MAKSVGKYTGIGFRPLQGDVASDILNAEDQEFKHRAEDRLIADRKAKAKADKDKKAQEGLNRAKALKLYDTESDSLNATIAEAVTIATNEYPAIFEILDDTTGKYSQQDKIKAKLKYDNILNLPENLKTMTNSVMAEYQDYQKGVASGTLFRDEKFEKKFENGFQGVSISLDDNGLPVSIFKGTGQDLDGDGIIDVETMGSLNDVYDRPQFQKNFSYDAMVKQHSEKLKSAVNQTDNGITSVKTTGVEPNLLDDTVTRFLYNNDGTPTAPMLAFLRQRNMDPNNPEDLKQVENDYKNDVYLRTSRGKEVNVDGGTALANRKYNDENVKGISFVESKQYGNGKDAVAQRYAFNTPYVVKGTNKSDRPKTLTEIRYDQQNGNIVLMGTEYAGKTTTKETGDSSSINPEDFPSYDAFMLAQASSGQDSSKTSTVSEDDWKPVEITNKAEVTSILSNVMGVGSYDEITNQLKRQEETTKEDSNKKTIEGF